MSAQLQWLPTRPNYALNGSSVSFPVISFAVVALVIAAAPSRKILDEPANQEVVVSDQGSDSKQLSSISPLAAKQVATSLDDPFARSRFDFSWDAQGVDSLQMKGIVYAKLSRFGHESPCENRNLLHAFEFQVFAKTTFTNGRSDNLLLYFKRNWEISLCVTEETLRSVISQPDGARLSELKPAFHSGSRRIRRNKALKAIFVESSARSTVQDSGIARNDALWQVGSLSGKLIRLHLNGAAPARVEPIGCRLSEDEVGWLRVAIDRERFLHPGACCCSQTNDSLVALNSLMPTRMSLFLQSKNLQGEGPCVGTPETSSDSLSRQLRHSSTHELKVFPFFFEDMFPSQTLLETPFEVKENGTAKIYYQYQCAGDADLDTDVVKKLCTKTG